MLWLRCDVVAVASALYNYLMHSVLNWCCWCLVAMLCCDVLCCAVRGCVVWVRLLVLIVVWRVCFMREARAVRLLPRWCVGGVLHLC